MPKRYTVLGLPYRRTQEELPESPFLKCLDKEQWRALALWLGAAPVGATWGAVWAGEEGLVRVNLQRVA